ncbi:EamA family transporter [Candidatus Beckwithbacteria bacterium]|nr:EamA family transporter [Candidatus Beckwithbacteria bacterium]
MSIVSYLYGGRLATNWTYILIAAIVFVIGETLYLMALKIIDVSIIAPLFNIRVAITVILSFIILGESLTNKSLYLIILIFIAGFLLSWMKSFH